MPSDEYAGTHFEALDDSPICKAVNARLTAATLATVWAPSLSTLKFRLKGYYLRAVVTTVCNGSEVAGNRLVLCDSVITVPLATIGVLASAAPVAGTSWPGILTKITPDPTATVFVNEPQAQPVTVAGGRGYLSATANNSLKFGLVDGAATPAAVTINTGVIVLSGWVWGSEE